MKVAVVGLDSVAEMALPTLDWAWAREVHGHLVGAWHATPVHTVVAEGLSTPAELDQLMRCVADDVGILTVVLTMRYAVARRRALQDPDRLLSKDPDFLKGDHERFERGLPDIACDLSLDNAEAAPTTLAERVIVTLDGRKASDL